MTEAKITSCATPLNIGISMFIVHPRNAYLLEGGTTAERKPDRTGLPLPVFQSKKLIFIKLIKLSLVPVEASQRWT